MPRRRSYISPVDERAIGKRLRELRLRRGISQVEMAQKLGITQGLVSEYELGKLRLHGALIAAFAKVLRATSDEILGLRNIPEDGTTVDRRLARRVKEIQKLSRTNRQALLKTVDAFLEIYGPK